MLSTVTNRELFPVVALALFSKFYHFQFVSQLDIRWSRKHTTKCRLEVHEGQATDRWPAGLLGSSGDNAHVQNGLLKFKIKKFVRS